MSKKLIWVIGLFVVIALVTSLGITSCKEKAVAKAEPPLVGFGMYFYQDQWWKDMKSAAEAKAAEVGIVLNVADGNGDAAKQVGQLEAFIGMGAKGIIYAPIEPEASQSVVAEAKQKGIPVINIESAINDRTNISCWVQLDQFDGGYQLGKLAGKFINDNYGGTGKALLLVDYSNSVLEDRLKGFKKGLAEVAPKSVIADEQDAACERATAMSVTENVLIANPDIAVIFGANTEMGMGAAAALGTKGADPAKVAVYTEGWGSEFYDAMVNDPAYMKAYMTGPSVPIAEKSVTIMADFLLKGTAFNEIESVVMDIITKDNIDKFKMSYFQ